MNEGIFLIAVLSFAVVYYIDMGLQAIWNSFYFRFGFPIYQRTYGPIIKAKLDTNSLEQMTSEGSFQTIKFKQNHDGHIFFREVIFYLNLKFGSFPVMRGIIQQDTSEIIIKGLINPGSIAMFLLGIFAITIGGFLIIFGISCIISVFAGYAIQRYRYNKIGEYILSTSN